MAGESSADSPANLDFDNSPPRDLVHDRCAEFSRHLWFGYEPLRIGSGLYFFDLALFMSSGKQGTVMAP